MLVTFVDAYIWDSRTSSEVKDFLHSNYSDVKLICAYGSEIVKCFNILGRNPPNFNTMDSAENSYIFIGDNAKEIAANWY